MKAIEQYFPVVLFIMLYMLVLTFEFVDEILKAEPSNKSYWLNWATLSCGAVYYSAQVGDKILKCLKYDHWNELNEYIFL